MSFHLSSPGAAHAAHVEPSAPPTSTSRRATQQASSLETTGVIARNEADSILAYTGLGSVFMNDKLRRTHAAGGGPFAASPESTIAKLDSGIAKIAATDTSLKKSFRGVPNHPAGIRENSVYADAAYLSTSRADTPESRKLLRGFTKHGDLFVIFGKSGADLALHRLSEFAGEREILYPRDMKFDVLLHADVSQTARSLIPRGRALSPGARRVTVLEERGMPDQDPQARREKNLESDISPAIDPTRGKGAQSPPPAPASPLRRTYSLSDLAR